PLITGERSGDPSDLDLELVSEPLFIPDEDGVAELDTRIAGSLDRLISQRNDARRAVAQIVREQIVRAAELNPPVIDLEITSPVFSDRVLVPIVRDSRVIIDLQATADTKRRFLVTKRKPNRVAIRVHDLEMQEPVLVHPSKHGRRAGSIASVDLVPPLRRGVLVPLKHIPVLPVLVPRRQTIRRRCTTRPIAGHNTIVRSNKVVLLDREISPAIRRNPELVRVTSLVDHPPRRRHRLSPSNGDIVPQRVQRTSHRQPRQLIRSQGLHDLITLIPDTVVIPEPKDTIFVPEGSAQLRGRDLLNQLPSILRLNAREMRQTQQPRVQNSTIRRDSIKQIGTVRRVRVRVLGINDVLNPVVIPNHHSTDSRAVI